MSLRNKDQLIKLIAGYIREIEKDFSQIIPSEINKLLFEFYYNPFVWRQDGFHGDDIIFVDEHTLKTKQGKRGIAVVDTVIDGNYNDTFDFKVVIKDLKGAVTIGFFAANDDNNPDIKTTDDIMYNQEIHSLNGAMMVIYTIYSYSWACLDSRLRAEGVTTGSSMNYPNGRLDATKANLSEMEFGIRFNMKEHEMNVYFKNVLLGTPFKTIPNRIIPTIGLYGDTGDSYKCTVIIKQEEITCKDD